MYGFKSPIFVVFSFRVSNSKFSPCGCLHLGVWLRCTSQLQLWSKGTWECSGDIQKTWYPTLQSISVKSYRLINILDKHSTQQEKKSHKRDKKWSRLWIGDIKTAPICLCATLRTKQLRFVTLRAQSNLWCLKVYFEFPITRPLHFFFTRVFLAISHIFFTL